MGFQGRGPLVLAGQVGVLLLHQACSPWMAARATPSASTELMKRSSSPTPKADIRTGTRAIGPRVHPTSPGSWLRPSGANVSHSNVLRLRLSAKRPSRVGEPAPGQ
jgi:hypothetical protein